MKQENLNWIAGFLGGILTAMLIIYLFMCLIPFSEPNPNMIYNAFTGEDHHDVEQDAGWSDDILSDKV